MTPAELLRTAESIVELERYLRELKDRAVSAPAIVAIVRRGYLKPNEELALRQMQLSYWQCRNALLEIVDGTEEVDLYDSEFRPEPFLVAFGAATLAVDAGRFLRERYHRARPIRRKFDGPDPIYGVPARMYESVQRSLTHPSHAWRLLEARRYYDTRRLQLIASCKAPPWSALIEVIDRYVDRLRPGWWTYLRTLLRVRGRKLARQVNADCVGLGLYQLQRLVSSLLSDLSTDPGRQPGMPTEVKAEVLAAIRPGDVYVVRKEHAATNYFLPGYWPHAALHIGALQDLQNLAITTNPEVETRLSHFADTETKKGDDSQSSCSSAATSATPKRVLEAMKDGVRLRPVDSPLASDSVAILRPRLSEKQIGEALARAMAHEGKPYDFDFDFACSHRLVEGALFNTALLSVLLSQCRHRHERQHRESECVSLDHHLRAPSLIALQLSRSVPDCTAKQIVSTAKRHSREWSLGPDSRPIFDRLAVMYRRGVLSE